MKLKVRLVTIELTLPRRLYDEFNEKIVPKYGEFNVAIIEAMRKLLKETKGSD
ncbi:MAG: hypothetical protein H3Z53_03040 [archaeon]|nr:hypothetical protein [archaeon]